MSTLSLSLARPRRLRFAEIVVELFAGMRDGLRIARRYHELEAMSDAELSRLGLARKDIARVAVQSVG